MDHVTLHKKLSTYLSEKGQLRNLPEDLLCEVLGAWEGWPGKAKEFYKSVGFSYKQMAGIIGKAKRLKREGYFPGESFIEIQREDQLEKPAPTSGGCGDGNLIELQWNTGKIIRFPKVEQLIEFLGKAS